MSSSVRFRLDRHQRSAATMGVPMWLVGVIISIVGSVFSNFGQNVQKFAMVRPCRARRTQPRRRSPARTRPPAPTSDNLLPADEE